MAQIPRDSLNFSRPRDAGCVTRVGLLAGEGIFWGVVGSALHFTYKFPSLKTPGAQGAFSAMCMKYAPVLATAGAVFGTVECTLDANREVRDSWNSAAGGAAAGLVVALMTRGPKTSAATVAMTAFGFGAAMGVLNLLPAMGPTADERQLVRVDPRTNFGAGRDLSNSTSVTDAVRSSFVR